MRKLSADAKDKLFFDCLAAALALLVGTPWFFASAYSFSHGHQAEGLLWGLGAVVFPILFLVKPGFGWGCALQILCVALALGGPLIVRTMQLPPNFLPATILIVIIAAAVSVLHGWSRRGKEK